VIEEIGGARLDDGQVVDDPGRMRHEVGNPRATLPMTREGVFLGTQSFHLLSPETAFRISALHESTANLEHSLRSLLSLSPLRVLHWINLGRSKIQLISLTK
jgi:hypothetical protein